MDARSRTIGHLAGFHLNGISWRRVELIQIALQLLLHLLALWAPFKSHAARMTILLTVLPTWMIFSLRQYDPAIASLEQSSVRCGLTVLVGQLIQRNPPRLWFALVARGLVAVGAFWLAKRPDERCSSWKIVGIIASMPLAILVNGW